MPVSPPPPSHFNVGGGRSRDHYPTQVPKPSTLKWGEGGHETKQCVSHSRPPRRLNATFLQGRLPSSALQSLLELLLILSSPRDAPIHQTNTFPLICPVHGLQYPFTLMGHVVCLQEVGQDFPPTAPDGLTWFLFVSAPSFDVVLWLRARAAE